MPENNDTFKIDPVTPPVPVPPASICPVCHAPVLPEYYFCPNCGTNLRAAPPKTDALTQAGIYLFSIVLPMIAFIAVTRWPGIKYMRSGDPRARAVGITATVLLAASTIITCWLAYVWIVQAMQSAQQSVQSINTLGL